MCSLAARGLWIDLIAYMHEGEPYGHLTIDGTRPTLADIAGLVGRPAREVEGAFGELTRRGVFEMVDGAITSRRMRRDKARDDENIANGKRGGNPDLIAPVNGGVNPPVPWGDKAQKLDTRSQIKKEEEIVGRSGPTRVEDDFDIRFWKPYPRTPVMSKKQALAEWRKLDPHSRDKASAALPSYKSFLKSKPDHPVVHACRFLSQRRFDGFAEAEGNQPKDAPLLGFYAKDGSEEITAWDQHWKATRGKHAPRDRNFGWSFETQWPPGHPRGGEVSGNGEGGEQAEVQGAQSEPPGGGASGNGRAPGHDHGGSGAARAGMAAGEPGSAAPGRVA
jgi:hypothetical protein